MLPKSPVVLQTFPVRFVDDDESANDDDDINENLYFREDKVSPRQMALLKLDWHPQTNVICHGVIDAKQMTMPLSFEQ